jgi:peptidoglycan hydrolase-like protein with peptidoglycan-binding domain
VRHPRLLAVAVSAVVGIAGGVGGALLIHDSPPIIDPLQLGVSLVNQTCTGQTLLMLGWGPAASPLSAGLQENPGHGHYLETKQSCDTAWGLKGHGSPRYVAYLGPFDTRAQACELRMTAQYRGDRVTSLNAGNTDPVECVCYLPSVTMPLLRIGSDPSALNSIWIRSLQGMLADLRHLPPDHVTGVYDLATEAAVKEFQNERALPTSGVVDTATWSSLKTKACGLYDS